MDDRRAFFKKLIGMFGVAAVVSKARVAFARKLAIALDKVPALSKVGGSVEVKLAGKDIMLVRQSDKVMRGISPICTHQHCKLTYNAKTTHMDCSCHGSSFDLNGKVLKGPATKNLKTYPAVLDGKRIIITVE